MKQAARAIWSEMLPSSPVFTTAAVARTTGLRTSNASRDLAALAADGLITRIRRGLWAVVTHPDFSPFAVVPHLFEAGEQGYVSLLSALNLHGMIEQIPRVVHVMTTVQRPRLETPVGTYEFHQIHAELFDGFGPYRNTGNFDIATPEKALFDTLYLSARKGRRFSHLPEIELPDDFSSGQMDAWIAEVDHGLLRQAVAERWRVLAKSASGAAA